MSDPDSSILYDHDGVKLTRRLLTAGAAAYTVATIGGVRVDRTVRRHPDRRRTAILRSVVMPLVTLLALGVSYAVVGVRAGWQTPLVWLGSVVTVVAVWMASVVRLAETRYALVVTVGGRDTIAAVFDEPDEPKRLAAAVAAVIGA